MLALEDIAYGIINLSAFGAFSILTDAEAEADGVV